MHITRADFGDPRLAAFLQAHLDDMEPTAPPESRHALDLTALQGDGVRLWVGADGDGILGTVALAAVDDGHEELKSMRTEPRVRGTGVATSLLAHALDDARRRGVSRVSLETGSMEFFEPARRFYARAGFTPCEPVRLLRRGPAEQLHDAGAGSALTPSTYAGSVRSPSCRARARSRCRSSRRGGATIRATMARPRPGAGARRARPGWWSGSSRNSCSWSGAEMPMPVSSTVATTARPAS